MEDIKLLQGAPAIYQDLGLYSGYIPQPVEKLDSPVLRWKGAKITKELWEQVTSFMRWTYDTFHSEAQCRLFYNELTHEWDVGVFPQYIRTGMSSDEIDVHPLREEVFQKFPPDKGWKEAGTVHHHCRSGAFQSGTDHEDEIEKNGYHITLGDMEMKEKHSFHARASFRKVMYGVCPADWMESEVIQDPARKHSTNPFQVKSSRRHFPNEWKKYLIDKTTTTPNRTGSTPLLTGFANKGWSSRGVSRTRSHYGTGRRRTRPCYSSTTPDWDSMEVTMKKLSELDDAISVKLEDMEAEDYMEYLELLDDAATFCRRMAFLNYDAKEAAKLIKDAQAVRKKNIILSSYLIDNMSDDIFLIKEWNQETKKEVNKANVETVSVSSQVE